MTPELAEIYFLPFDDLSGVKIPQDALERLTAADARRLGVAPLRVDGNLLYVATSRPVRILDRHGGQRPPRDDGGSNGQDC